MSGNLYLRLTEGDTVSWMVRGPEGTALAEGPLEQAAARAVGQRLIVLVPAADAVITEARLPARQTRHLRQAVPFAIEEQLSDDVERLHFALAPKRAADGSQPVAVVSRERMAQWLARLDGAGLHPAVMVPESLALPWNEEEWTLFVDQEGALLRTGPARGYGLEADGLDAMLAIALEQAAEKPKRLWLLNGGIDAAPLHAACAEVEVPVAEEAINGGRLSLLSGSHAVAPVIDLLQGDFSRREDLGKLWRPWRFAAVLFVVWAVLQTGLGAYHYVSLKRESAQLKAEIEQLYRDAFPEARNITDPRLQMEKHLADLRGGSGGGPFVSLITRAAPVLRGSAGTDIGALRFKDGVLEVEFAVANFQAVDQLKQALAGAQLQVETQNVSARDGKTQGVLRLREGK